MKGLNKIQFNQTQMEEAIEYYLNEKVFSRDVPYIKVTNIVKVTNGFEISFTPKPNA
jgi:hypothetical protein